MGILSKCYKGLKWGSLALSIIDPDLGTEIHEKLSEMEEDVVDALDAVEDTIVSLI